MSALCRKFNVTHKTMMKTLSRSLLHSLLAASMLFGATLTAQAQKSPKPLKVLLITGGCCHAYASQKGILKEGIEARAHAIVTQVHTDDSTTNPPLAIYGDPDYAKGYDVVIHDECAAAMADIETVKGVLAPHRNGIPGVNLHCAMHSYRTGNHKEASNAGTNNSLWFDYLGIQSSGHGPKEPIAIEIVKKKHPITKVLSDWATINEELYNNVQIFESANGLAKGFQHQKERKLKNGKVTPAQDAEAVVVWTNEYHDTRVFSTTIGHYDETVADDRYLDLVTRGLLWSCKKLNDNYLK
ncbi:MAG: hypothetical protein HOI15_10695 [Opitutales bacterium]|nr:hypothetical protein [Opitutales bacterium]MBT5814798.1 hypothetical protein [Opitutales bacterium]MBT6768743.1 hypothetical protein [Opitutales bacterium]